MTIKRQIEFIEFTLVEIRNKKSPFSPSLILAAEEDAFCAILESLKELESQYETGIFEGYCEKIHGQKDGFEQQPKEVIFKDSYGINSGLELYDVYFDDKQWASTLDKHKLKPLVRSIKFLWPKTVITDRTFYPGRL